nr:MAG TPA: hypothetical protein [Caudoviricetes sp.]
MSIDYDRLRGLLQNFDQAETPYAKWESHTAISVRAVATTRELLRQRDGIERVLAQMNDHATLLRGWEQHNLAYHIEQYARLLADELNGDTE